MDAIRSRSVSSMECIHTLPRLADESSDCLVKHARIKLPESCDQAFQV